MYFNYYSLSVFEVACFVFSMFNVVDLFCGFANIYYLSTSCSPDYQNTTLATPRINRRRKFRKRRKYHRAFAAAYAEWSCTFNTFINRTFFTAFIAVFAMTSKLNSVLLLVLSLEFAVMLYIVVVVLLYVPPPHYFRDTPMEVTLAMEMSYVLELIWTSLDVVYLMEDYGIRTCKLRQIGVPAFLEAVEKDCTDIFGYLQLKRAGEMQRAREQKKDVVVVEGVFEDEFEEKIGLTETMDEDELMGAESLDFEGRELFEAIPLAYLEQCPSEMEMTERVAFRAESDDLLHFIKNSPPDDLLFWSAVYELFPDIAPQPLYFSEDRGGISYEQFQRGFAQFRGGTLKVAGKMSMAKIVTLSASVMEEFLKLWKRTEKYTKTLLGKKRSLFAFVKDVLFLIRMCCVLESSFDWVVTFYYVLDKYEELSEWLMRHFYELYRLLMKSLTKETKDVDAICENYVTGDDKDDVYKYEKDTRMVTFENRTFRIPELPATIESTLRYYLDDPKNYEEYENVRTEKLVKEIAKGYPAFKATIARIQKEDEEKRKLFQKKCENIYNVDKNLNVYWRIPRERSFSGCEDATSGLDYAKKEGLLTGLDEWRSEMLARARNPHVDSIPPSLGKKKTKFCFRLNKLFRFRSEGFLKDAWGMHKSIIDSNTAVSIRKFLCGAVSKGILGDGIVAPMQEIYSELDKEKIKKKKISVLDFIGLAVDAIDSTVGVIVAKFNGSSIYSAFLGDAYGDFMDKTKDVIAKYDNVSFGVFDPRDDIAGGYDGKVVLRETTKWAKLGKRMDRPNAPMAFKKRLEELISNEAALFKVYKGSDRKMPFGIVLWGASGQGKSTILPYIYQTYCQHADIDYDDSLVYTKCMESEYWDGYDPLTQPIIRLPELGSLQSAIVKHSGDESLNCMLSVVDSAPYQLNMSKAEEKGTVYASPELVVADTNIPHLNAHLCVNNPEAVYRRFVYIHQRAKDQFLTGGRIDPKKLPENNFDRCMIYAFRVSIVKTKDSQGHPEHIYLHDGEIELPELLHGLSEMMRRHDQALALQAESRKMKVSEIMNMCGESMTKVNWFAEVRENAVEKKAFREPIDDDDAPEVTGKCIPFEEIPYEDCKDKAKRSGVYKCYDDKKILKKIRRSLNPVRKKLSKDIKALGVNVKRCECGCGRLVNEKYTWVSWRQCLRKSWWSGGWQGLSFLKRSVWSGWKRERKIAVRRFALGYWYYPNFYWGMTQVYYRRLMIAVLTNKYVFKLRVTQRYLRRSLAATTSPLSYADIAKIAATLGILGVTLRVAIKSIPLLLAKEEEKEEERILEFTKKVPTEKFLKMKQKYTVDKPADLSKSLEEKEEVVKSEAPAVIYGTEDINSYMKRSDEDILVAPPLKLKKKSVHDTYDKEQEWHPRIPANQLRLNNKDDILRRVENNTVHFFTTSHSGVPGFYHGFGLYGDKVVINTHSYLRTKFFVISWEKEKSVGVVQHAMEDLKAWHVSPDTTVVAIPGLAFDDSRDLLHFEPIVGAKDWRGETIHFSTTPVRNQYKENILCHYRYKPYESDEGDCGKPMLGYVGKQVFLLGVHSGRLTAEFTDEHVGSTVTFLSRTQLSQVEDTGFETYSNGVLRFSPTLTRAEPHPRNALVWEDAPGLRVWGSIKDLNLGVMKTSIKETPYIDEVEDVIGIPIKDEEGYLWGPPMMKHVKVDGEYFAPYNNWIRSIGQKRQPLNKEVSDKCVESIVRTITKRLISAGITAMTPYSLAIAQNGYTQNDFIRSMNMSTSAGIQLPGKKKDWAFAVESDGRMNYMPKTYIVETVADMEKAYDKGEMAHPIIGAQCKDEVRDRERQKYAKTRIFCMSSYQSILLARRYLLSLYSSMQAHGKAFSSLIGINMHSKASDELYKSLAKTPNTIIQGDYSGFDKKMPIDVGKSANDIVVKILTKFGYNRKALKRVNGILSDNLYPTVLMGGTVFQCPGLQPSGKYGTAEDNSIRNLFMLHYAFAMLCTEEGKNHPLNLTTKWKVGNFYDLVNPYIYGDDFVAGVSEDLPEFNILSYAEFSEYEFGLKITTPEKTTVSTPYVKVDDVNILKRTFRTHSALGRKVAVLEKKSLAKTLTHYLPSKSVEPATQFCESARSVLREVFFYDEREWFEKVRTWMVDKMTEIECGSKEALEEYFPTWETFVKVYQEKDGIVTMKSEAEISLSKLDKTLRLMRLRSFYPDIWDAYYREFVNSPLTALSSVKPVWTVDVFEELEKMSLAPPGRTRFSEVLYGFVYTLVNHHFPLFFSQLGSSNPDFYPSSPIVLMDSDKNLDNDIMKWNQKLKKKFQSSLANTADLCLSVRYLKGLTGKPNPKKEFMEEWKLASDSFKRSYLFMYSSLYNDVPRWLVNDIPIDEVEHKDKIISRWNRVLKMKDSRKPIISVKKGKAKSNPFSKFSKRIKETNKKLHEAGKKTLVDVKGRIQKMKADVKVHQRRWRETHLEMLKKEGWKEEAAEAELEMIFDNLSGSQYTEVVIKDDEEKPEEIVIPEPTDEEVEEKLAEMEIALHSEMQENSPTTEGLLTREENVDQVSSLNTFVFPSTGTEGHDPRFLTQEVPLFSYKLGTGTYFDQFFPYVMWSQLPLIKSRIRNRFSIKGTLKLRFTLSSSIYHAGKILIVWIPLKETPKINRFVDQSFKWWKKSSLFYTCEHKVILDIGVDDTAELALPTYLLQSAMYVEVKRNEVITKKGTLYFMPMAPMFHIDNEVAGDKLRILVTAKMENLELGPPTAYGYSVTAQAGGEEVEKEKQAETEKISSTATKVADAAAIVSQVPVLNPIATTIRAGALGVAEIAKMFGMSRPNVSQEYTAYRVRHSTCFTHSQTQDHAIKFTYDPLQGLDLKRMSPGQDQMALSTIYQRPGLLWVDTLPEEAMEVICRFPVFPGWGVLLTTDHFDILHTPLSWVSSHFYWWRGDLEYTFEIIAPSTARGRLFINYDPHGTTKPAFRDIHETYGVVVDLQETRKAVMKIAYTSTDHMKRCTFDYRKMKQGEEFARSAFNQGCSIGTIRARMLTAIFPTPSEVVPMRILVYVRGLQMEFMLPTMHTHRRFTKSKMIAQMYRSVTYGGQHHGDLFFHNIPETAQNQKPKDIVVEEVVETDDEGGRVKTRRLRGIGMKEEEKKKEKKRRKKKEPTPPSKPLMAQTGRPVPPAQPDYEKLEVDFEGKAKKRVHIDFPRNVEVFEPTPRPPVKLGNDDDEEEGGILVRTRMMNDDDLVYAAPVDEVPADADFVVSNINMDAVMDDLIHQEIDLDAAFRLAQYIIQKTGALDYPVHPAVLFRLHVTGYVDVTVVPRIRLSPSLPTMEEFNRYFDQARRAKFNRVKGFVRSPWMKNKLMSRMKAKRATFIAWLGRTYNYSGDHSEFSEEALAEIPFFRMRLRNKIKQYKERKKRREEERLRQLGEMQLASSAMEDKIEQTLNRTSLDVNGFYGSFIGERIVSFRQILKRDWLLYEGVVPDKGLSYLKIPGYPNKIKFPFVDQGTEVFWGLYDTYYASALERAVKPSKIDIYRTPFNNFDDPFKLIRGSIRYRVLNGREAHLFIGNELEPYWTDGQTMRNSIASTVIRGDEVLEFEVPYFHNRPYTQTNVQEEQLGGTKWGGYLYNDLHVMVRVPRKERIKVWVSIGEDFNFDLWESVPYYWNTKVFFEKNSKDVKKP